MRMPNHLSNLIPALALAAFLLVLASLASGQAGAPASSCAACVEWNRPQQPFRVYGNTYYVGPRGLSSILLTSNAGHVLIDGALPESALESLIEQVEKLDMEDVRKQLAAHQH